MEMQPEQNPRREADRLANLDPIRIRWNQVIQKLADAYSRINEPESIRITRLLEAFHAIAEFVAICYRKRENYSDEEKRALLDRMVEINRCDVPLRRASQPNIEIANELFLEQLHALIEGMKNYLAQLDDEDDIEMLGHFRTWAVDAMCAAVPAYAPPYKAKADIKSAKLCCDNYRIEQAKKRNALHRVGCALGIFVECFSLEKTEMGNLAKLPEEALLLNRIAILQERYRAIKALLHKVDKLSPELEHALIEEEKNCIDRLKQDPKTELQHPSSQIIYCIFEELLAKDTAAVLNEYTPNLGRVENPDEPLATVIKREYYPDLHDVQQATVLGQALRILDHEFRTMEENKRERLLGDHGTMSEEKLEYTLLGYTELDQLQILENLYRKIIENEEGKYVQLKSRYQKKKLTTAQVDHIEMLQEKYLAIVKANPTPDVKKMVIRSLLMEGMQGAALACFETPAVIKANEGLKKGK